MKGINPKIVDTTVRKIGIIFEFHALVYGCIIEGEVENSILFRGVRIAKGAKVKNCVLMQDTIVGEGANVEYVITDKNVTISAGKEIKGADSFPVYVAKYRSV